MPGRFALLAAPVDDPDATTLATILADPQRGDFTVEQTVDPDAIAHFVQARTPTDVVLIYTDGTDVDFAACASTHMLVLAADDHAAVEPDKGRAVIAGAPAGAVVRALRAGRADRDADGEVTARELYNRMRHTLELQMRSGLDRPFVVSLSPRPAAVVRRRRNERVRRRGHVWVALAGAVVLLVGLPLPWVFGESGLAYAFGDGTAWPSRVAPLACLTLVGVAAYYAWRPFLPAWVVVAGGAVAGTLGGFVSRLDDADFDAGFAVTLVGLGVVVAAGFVVARRRSDVWLATFGAIIAGRELVTSLDVLMLGLAAVLLAAGTWVIRTGRRFHYWPRD